MSERRACQAVGLSRSVPRFQQKPHLDNGPELVSVALARWTETHAVELCLIQPCKPMQNGFTERFNGSYCRGVLDIYDFRNLTEVREQTETYNYGWP